MYRVFCALMYVVPTLLLVSAAGAAPTDACAVLTLSQIQSVLGVPVSAGQPITPTIRTSCKWLEAGVDAFQAKTVIVSIKSEQAFAAGKVLRSSRLTTAPLGGIGDEAYMTSGTISYGATLSVRKNGGAFSVTVRGYPDVATIQAKDIAIAKLVTF
jgi:hypothetical protein